MKIEVLNRPKAQEAMNRWINDRSIPSLSSDYKKIRNDLSELFQKVNSNEEIKNSNRYTYLVDVQFGAILYTYLNDLEWFSLRIASDDDFWRYMSICVVPEMVADRFWYGAEEHYWSNGNRIWLKSLWWYFHLSWQGDLGATKELLLKPCFSTDTIMNFVERSGRFGTYIEVYRNIIRCMGNVRSEDFERYAQRGEDLFRVVMKLNTAKVLVMEPGLCEDKEIGYVKYLFSELGIKI